MAADCPLEKTIRQPHFHALKTQDFITTARCAGEPGTPLPGEDIDAVGWARLRGKDGGDGGVSVLSESWPADSGAEDVIIEIAPVRFGRWGLLARVVLSAGSRLDRRWASKRYRRAYFGG